MTSCSASVPAAAFVTQYNLSLSIAFICGSEKLRHVPRVCGLYFKRNCNCNSSCASIQILLHRTEGNRMRFIHH